MTCHVLVCCADLCRAVLCSVHQADQAEDFDIMDDVLLMTDDPSTPAGDDDEDEGSGNPAAGAACGDRVLGVLVGDCRA